MLLKFKNNYITGTFTYIDIFCFQKGNSCFKVLKKMLNLIITVYYIPEHALK